MDINGFKAELETRLLVEKQNLVKEFFPIDDFEEKTEILGKFNEKYRELIRQIASENAINLNAPYQIENNSLVSDSNLSYEKIILGKTMSIYDKLVEELYEEITSIN